MWVYLWVWTTIDDYSAMQWPAPSWFHVPLNTERQAVRNIRVALWGWSSDWTNFGIALKLPFAGYRSFSNSNVYSQGTNGYYWSSSRSSANSAYFLRFFSGSLMPQNADRRAIGMSIRPFKNEAVIPTSSWTKLYWTSIESWGIFWSSTDWLISMSSDWQTWITIADKNLWATQVWNSWDTLSQNNCWKYYQWGNNYWFPFTWSVTTSSTRVNASNYWPWNYYSSSTFITWSDDRSSVQNDNLRWWVTGVQPKTIYPELKNAYIGEVYEYSYDFRGKTTSQIQADGFTNWTWTPQFSSNWIYNSSSTTLRIKKWWINLTNARKLTMKLNGYFWAGSYAFRVAKITSSNQVSNYSWMYFAVSNNQRQLEANSWGYLVSWLSAWSYTATAEFDFINKTSKLVTSWYSDITYTLTDAEISDIRANTDNIFLYLSNNNSSSYISDINITIE